MADNNKLTRRVVMDVQTGVLYGLAFDDKGDVKGARLMSEGPIVQDPNGGGGAPGMPPGMPGMPGGPKPVTELPYGDTSYAIDPTGKGEFEVFTIVWPEKEDAENGKMPAVASKVLPADLVKAGIAAWPDELKSAAQRDLESEAELKEALNNIMELIGLDNVKRDLKENIALARYQRAKSQLGLEGTSPSLHMVFTGNPGTGKTTVAREYAKVLKALGFIKKATVHEVTRKDLVAGYVGQTALKTREEIDKAKGGILFIDEAYALSRSSSSKDFGTEAIDELVSAMENMRDNLVVIVAGYPEPMKKFIDANEGLKSRFMTYLEFKDYNLDDLGQILDLMVKQRGYSITADAREKALEAIDKEMKLTKENFGNGRTVRNMVEKAEKNLAMRLDQEGKLTKVDPKNDEIKEELTTITLSDVESIDLAGVSELTKDEMGWDTGIGKKEKKVESKPDNPFHDPGEPDIAGFAGDFNAAGGKSTPSNDDTPRAEVNRKKQSHLKR